MSVRVRAGRSLKLPNPNPHPRTLNPTPHPVCNQFSKSAPDSILLFHMELMLNTIDVTGLHFFKSHAVAFCLRTRPKLDYLLGVLFQQLRVEGSSCFDLVSRFLLYIKFAYWCGCHFHIVAQKNNILIFSLLGLTQARLELFVCLFYLSS